jgi:hypothetical protein
MIDRTDLQLMLVEQLFEMDTESLIDVFREITGHDLEIRDAETEQMSGSLASLRLADPPQLKKLLGFLLYAFGERVQIPA